MPSSPTAHITFCTLPEFVRPQIFTIAPSRAGGWSRRARHGGRVLRLELPLPARVRRIGTGIRSDLLAERRAVGGRPADEAYRERSLRRLVERVGDRLELRGADRLQELSVLDAHGLARALDRVRVLVRVLGR